MLNQQIGLTREQEAVEIGNSLCENNSPDLAKVNEHFYSPKGYRYVRTIFDNALPAVSTIRKWYTSINGKPGLSSEAFTALKLKADEANRNGKEILACILFDEMAIRKQEEFDEHNNQKIGQVNYGTNVIQTDERKLNRLNTLEN